MQRVRKQEQSVSDLGFVGAEHSGLTTAVRVTSEEDFARNFFAKRFDRALQSLLIAGVLARMRRPEWPKLAKRQITTQDGKSCICESFGYGNQQRRPAVCPSAVSQNQSIAVGICGVMQKSADGRVNCGIGKTFEGTDAGHCSIYITL